MFRGLTQSADSAVTGTAAWLACACAILSKDDHFGSILNDPDALYFAQAISDEAPSVLAQFDDPTICAAYILETETAMPGSLSVVAYRKPEMQRLAIEALKATGATQMVVLGVGCDTIALRLARLGICPTIYEIDRLGVINFRENVKAGIDLDLGHVHGIAVDFEQEHFGEKLIANGYNPKARTVFFAEGLLGYLNIDAIDTMFAFIRQNTASGSRFVFSFTERRTANAADRVPNSDAIEKQGETLSFDLPPTEATAFIEAQGIRLVELITAEDLTEMYRSRHQGRVHILPFLHIAVAATV